MTYKVNFGRDTKWSHASLVNKLKGLGQLSGRDAAWIRRDLNLGRSSCLTRLIWTLVAKHFKWMRKFFYNVDLDQSRKILKDLYPQINTPKLNKLYFAALRKFNEIAPNHFYHPDAEAAIQKHLKESGFNEKPLLEKKDFWSLSKKQILHLSKEVKRGWIEQLNDSGQSYQSVGLVESQFLQLVKTEGQHLKNLFWNENAATLAAVIPLCPNLTHLTLKFTPLSNELIQTIATLKNLRSLRILRLSPSISENHLDFSPIGRNCLKLETLELKGCNLSQFPVEFGNLKNLTSLDLTNSISSVDIIKLDNTLSKLRKLEEVDFSMNKLQHLPECLSTLPYLQSLKLQYTEFPTFPNSLGKLSNLTHLDLKGSRSANNFFLQPHYPVAEIDQALGRLIKLEDLNLCSLGLQTPPPSLSKLTKLQTLDLSSNIFQTLPEDIFLPLVKLQKLDLTSTGIHRPPIMTVKLPQLKECKVTGIPKFLWEKSYPDHFYSGSKYSGKYPSGKYSGGKYSGSKMQPYPGMTKKFLKSMTTLKSLPNYYNSAFQTETEVVQEVQKEVQQEVQKEVQQAEIASELFITEWDDDDLYS